MSNVSNPQAGLTGPERAAILLMTLGEQNAASILKYMKPKEVQKVGSAMAMVSNVSKIQVGEILAEFMSTAGEQTALGVGSEEYIRSVLTAALGEERADGLLERILAGRNSKGLEALKWMDARDVAELIRHEHPQVMAIVLSHLDSDHAAEVMSFIPDRLRPDVVMRIATLDRVQPNALSELDRIIEKQFSGKGRVQSSVLGGMQAAADILNAMDVSVESGVMDQIKESDETLGQRLQDLMFAFENLLDVDDRGIQALLREISTESLILALKGSSEALKEKIFKNVSKRAAEALREDLETTGPVRMSEVNAAQKEILEVARRMAEARDIVLGERGGDELV